MPADDLLHQQYLLATVPPGRAARLRAVSVIAASITALVLAAPFASVRLPFIPPLLSAYASVITVNDLITTILLAFQFVWLRRRSLLVIAAGYLFATCLNVMHVLSFPGVFAPSGLLGPGSQTTTWLYLLWHMGFPLFILAYALVGSSKRDVLPVSISTRSALLTAVVAVVALAGGCALVSTIEQRTLPIVIVDGDARRVLALGISPIILGITGLAIAAMWRRRNATVLDLWLFSVTCIWFCEVSITAMFGTTRFSLGWYAGRAFGLLGSSLVLGSLLLESSRLYAKLKDALLAAEVQNAVLVRTRSEFAQIQRLETLGQLTGGIAHDFNNLLAVIVGSLDMISRRPQDLNRVGGLAENARQAAERGTQLIRQLMTFARKQNLQPEVVNPNAVLLGSRNLASRAAGDKITMTFALDQEIHPVLVDVTEFQAAILNLVGNARDAMPHGGMLKIESRNVEFGQTVVRYRPDVTPGHYVMISVADDGEGMSAETKARIFEPFFTTKPLGKGTGLGLSQVYGFAKSANGDVVVKTKLNAGTTFTLYLPRSPAGQSTLRTAKATPVRTAQAGETVLAVEDNPYVMSTTVAMLRELGYIVLPSASGEDALMLLKEDRRIDILFSDVAMPGGMNGIQLALIAGRLRPGLKILLTSGYAKMTLEGHRLPNDLPLLNKPYGRDELAEKLRRTLDAEAGLDI